MAAASACVDVGRHSHVSFVLLLLWRYGCCLALLASSLCFAPPIRHPPSRIPNAPPCPITCLFACLFVCLFFAFAVPCNLWFVFTLLHFISHRFILFCLFSFPTPHHPLPFTNTLFFTLIHRIFPCALNPLLGRAICHYSGVFIDTRQRSRNLYILQPGFLLLMILHFSPY